MDQAENRSDIFGKHERLRRHASMLLAVTLQILFFSEPRRSHYQSRDMRGFEKHDVAAIGTPHLRQSYEVFLHSQGHRRNHRRRQHRVHHFHKSRFHRLRSGMPLSHLCFENVFCFKSEWRVCIRKQLIVIFHLLIRVFDEVIIVLN